jgi:hypothetical protein
MHTADTFVQNLKHEQTSTNNEIIHCVPTKNVYQVVENIFLLISKFILLICIQFLIFS